MKTLKNILIAVILIAVASCGGDYDDGGFFSVSGRIDVVDKEFWPSSQTIMFGIFIPGNKQPEQSTVINVPDGTETTFNLSNIPEGSYELKVYVSERSIHKVDLFKYSTSVINSDFELPLKNLTLLSFNRIQEQVFSSCLQCHGASSGDVAAGLNLLPANSYNNLVDIQAKNSELMRVKTNDAVNSFILRVLNKDNLSFDHSASTTATEGDIQLVTDWINNGALDN